MKKIFIQTSNEQLKSLIEEWRKNNNNISEELEKLILAALELTLTDNISLDLL